MSQHTKQERNQQSKTHLTWDSAKQLHLTVQPVVQTQELTVHKQHCQQTPLWLWNHVEGKQSVRCSHSSTETPVNDCRLLRDRPPDAGYDA